MFPIVPTFALIKFISFYNFEFWKELGKNIADYSCKINVNFR